MSWDFYSLRKGKNGNPFFRAEGKLKRGCWSKNGYIFDKDTLTIYRGKGLPHKVIMIKPKNRFDYDAKRLVSIADKFFGKKSIDLIYKRGGFFKTGRYKFKKRGRRFKQIPELSGVAIKIWERKKMLTTYSH